MEKNNNKPSVLFYKYGEDNVYINKSN